MDSLAPPPSLLRPGRVVGDYILKGELGRGGFGVVFDAEDARDGSRVALKTLRADLSSSQGQRALTRFLLEVRAVRQIQHPNVVKYIDAGQLNGDDGSVLAYYAMELLHGETLDQLVKRSGPMKPLEAASVIRQAAVGLYTAHCQGIIHRDVKPGNIILTPSGRAVVTDFGVCKILELQNVTTAGQVVGTARYLSPEQFLGAPLDARSDVFALGALFFYLLTGEHLRIQKDLIVLSRIVAQGEDIKRVKDAREIPGSFRKVLVAALARDPNHRYQTALELAHAIEEASLHRDVVEKGGPLMRLPSPVHTPAPTPRAVVPLVPDPEQTQDEGDLNPTTDERRRAELFQPTEPELDTDALLDNEPLAGPSTWMLAAVVVAVAIVTAMVLAWMSP